ncbi:hypothetical protein Tchl_1145 [Thauera chlorobenzoica]|uniref:Uncharacterized protein n=1 Tax=Thauera chlorobenzoica TaxID=96773 RepID=A0A1L6FAQ8_9RHOO|nr:hypothetical protein Tchl_1145 [Thauera chlorobenzoica]
MSRKNDKSTIPGRPQGHAQIRLSRTVPKSRSTQHGGRLPGQSKLDGTHRVSERLRPDAACRAAQASRRLRVRPLSAARPTAQSRSTRPSRRRRAAARRRATPSRQRARSGGWYRSAACGRAVHGAVAWPRRCQPCRSRRVPLP